MERGVLPTETNKTKQNKQTKRQLTKSHAVDRSTKKIDSTTSTQKQETWKDEQMGRQIFLSLFSVSFLQNCLLAQIHLSTPHRSPSSLLFRLPFASIHSFSSTVFLFFHFVKGGKEGRKEGFLSLPLSDQSSSITHSYFLSYKLLSFFSLGCSLSRLTTSVCFL